MKIGEAHTKNIVQDYNFSMRSQIIWSKDRNEGIFRVLKRLKSGSPTGRLNNMELNVVMVTLNFR